MGTIEHSTSGYATIEKKEKQPTTENELFKRIANDARFFLESFCSVKGFTGGLVPFIFNAAQVDYYNRVWLGRVGRDIMVKSRKWGFTTERVGLGLHGAAYTEGRIFRIVSQRADTSYEINKTVKLLYDSAFKRLRDLGLDPEYFLPRRQFDNRKEYFFPDTQSAVIVDTARSRSVGQSDRSDDLYITEYSEWDDAEDRRAALDGSVPVGDGTRITIDFNAKGIGNDAYVQYQAAKRTESEDWNGFKALFYGTNECPDLYTPEFLSEKRRSLRDKFPQVYPSNDEEVWLQDSAAVFDWEDLQACTGREYYCESHKREEYIGCEFFHGVDTAPSADTKADWQVMKSFALVDGVLVEALPPIRTRIPEDVFAGMVHDRTIQLPGVVVVERNIGMAVMQKLKELGTQNLFKYRDPVNKDKYRVGFVTTLPSKRMMIADMQSLLRDGAISLVSENGIHEMRQFEWKDDPETKGAGAPKMKGSYDDECMAAMLAVQGMKRMPKPAKAHYKQ